MIAWNGDGVLGATRRQGRSWGVWRMGLWIVLPGLVAGAAALAQAPEPAALAAVHRAVLIPAAEESAEAAEPAAPPAAAPVPAEIPPGYRTLTYGGFSWAVDPTPALVLTAADLQGAEVEYGIVKIRIALGLGEAAAAAFTRLTEEQAGKALALYAGDALVSAATVPRPLRTSFIQTMAFKEDAQPLLDALRSAGIRLREVDRYADVKEPALREAVGHLERGETEAAAQAYERLLAEIGAEDPRTAGFRVMLAGLYQQLGELPKAKELLDQIVTGPITRDNRAAVLQAFQNAVDLMESLRNVPLRNQYLMGALNRLAESSAAHQEDTEFAAWCALSAGMLHARYMELERVPKVLEEVEEQAMPGGWHLLRARYHEVLQERDAALAEYRWIEQNSPDLADLARTAREQIEAGGWTFSRSPVSAMLDQMALEAPASEPQPGEGIPVEGTEPPVSPPGPEAPRAADAAPASTTP